VDKATEVPEVQNWACGVLQANPFPSKKSLSGALVKGFGLSAKGAAQATAATLAVLRFVRGKRRRMTTGIRATASLPGFHCIAQAMPNEEARRAGRAARAVALPEEAPDDNI